MNREFQIKVIENEKDGQLKHTLSRFIWASWAIYCIVICTTWYWGDLITLTVALVASIVQIVPFWLLRRGNLQASSLYVVLCTIGIVTTLATVGQGIRDIAILGYPIVFIFAGLILSPVFFRLCVWLTFGAICWLVFGEANGWFVPRPFYEDPYNLTYLVFVSSLLVITAYAVNLLATNSRNILQKAHLEIAKRQQTEKQLRYQSTHDKLTGIYNRTFFETELVRYEHSRDFPISIIVIDQDNLKVVNDTKGHRVGDALLRKTADLLRSVVRESDVLARIGGDEFVILLPATDVVSVKNIMARVKQSLLEYNAEHSDLPVELSLGAATAEKNNLIEAFKLADKRMYANKAERKLIIKD
jgi:diguanylate cyclase (GGDEF)-like protein